MPDRQREPSRLGTSTVVLISAAVLVPLALFLLAAWNDYRQVVYRAEDSSGRVAAVLEEHANKVFDTAELVFARIVDRISGRGWQELSASEADLHVFLKGIAEAYPQFSNILLIDTEGRARVQGRVFPAPRTVSAADREYFLRQKGADQGTFVDQLLTGRTTGSTVIGISKRIPTASGEFNGVIYLGIKASYFTDFWGGLSPGPDHLITMVRMDGEVLARHPLDRSMPRLQSDSPVLAAIRRDEVGMLHVESPLDRTSRIISFRRLDGHPVAVAYGYGYPSLVQAWRKNLIAYGLAALLSMGALLAVVSFALRQLKREQLAIEGMAGERQRRVKAETSLIHAQKMEVMGTLTGSVAHDFRNLLHVAIGTLSALRGKQRDERQERRVELALEALSKGEKLTQQLMAFARKQPLTPTVVNPNDALQSMLPLLSQALGRSIDVETRFTAQVWSILVDVTQLELSLLNLAVNARHAMPDGGTLRLKTENRRYDDHCGPDDLSGEFVAVTIADTGTGIAPEVLDRVFEPFFTTTAEGAGTGLGLAQVYGFVKQSGGTAIVRSKVGDGTEVALLFPRKAESAVQELTAGTEPGRPDNVVPLVR